jgi:hypothetical protein
LRPRAICVPDGVRAVCVPDGVRVVCVPDGSKATDPPLSVFGKVAQALRAERFSRIVALLTQKGSIQLLLFIENFQERIPLPYGVRVVCVPDGSKARDPPLSVFGKVAQPLLAERFSPIEALLTRKGSIQLLLFIEDFQERIPLPYRVRAVCVPHGSKATDPPLSVFGKVAQPLLAERFSPIVAAGGQGVRDNPIECNLP